MLIDSANICPPDSTELSVAIEGGVMPYTYSWNLAPEDNDTVSVAPVETTLYTVNVSDVCGSSLLVEGSTVYVQCPMGLPLLSL